MLLPFRNSDQNQRSASNQNAAQAPPTCAPSVVTKQLPEVPDFLGESDGERSRRRTAWQEVPPPRGGRAVSGGSAAVEDILIVHIRCVSTPVLSSS
jgi:hypothetical protein